MASFKVVKKNSKDSVNVEVAEKTTNPWLGVREPLRDTSFPERDLPETNLWLGCISVMNNDTLKKLTGTVRVFDHLEFRSAFSLAFGRQIQAGEGCLCKRLNLHTHFILQVIGEVKRSTAYQMACGAFQKLQLQPEDHYKAFSYLASVYKMDLLLETGMLCKLPEDNDSLAEQLEEAELIEYAELN